MVHLVGFTVEIYYDTWPYERQICGVCASAHVEVKHHLPADTRVIFDCFTSITFFQMTTLNKGIFNNHNSPTHNQFQINWKLLPSRTLCYEGSSFQF